MSHLQGRCRGYPAEYDACKKEPGNQLDCDLKRDKKYDINNIVTFVEDLEVFMYLTNDR